MEIPAAVLELANALREGRGQAFLVGGAPRDLLLGRPPHDFDLATDLRPDEVTATARAHGWGAIPVGEKFGTVTVVAGGIPVEVTTFRAEGRYEDGRRPAAVRFVDDVQADLARRDFTVNALALSLPEGRWVDPFHGREDLRRRRVRAVGDPGLRFAEDGLRLLRAVRIAAELMFRLEDATALALAVHAESLGRVAAERVGPELQRLLLAPGPGAAAGLRLLAYSGLAAVVLPEIAVTIGLPPDGEHHRLPLFEHTVQVVTLCPPRPALRWAALFHDTGKPWTREELVDGAVHYYGHDRMGARLFAAAARRLRLEREVAGRAEALVARHMFTFDMGPRGLRRLFAEFGEDGARDLLDLKLADMVGTGGAYAGQAYDAFRAFRDRFEAARAEATALGVRDLAIDGHDVMRELKIGPGPEVGRVLERLLDLVLERPELNEREALLERVRSGRPT